MRSLQVREKRRKRSVSSRSDVVYDGKEAELSPHRTPSPREHYFITREGTEMGTEIPAGCDKKHLMFAFHLRILFVMTARMLQNVPVSGAARTAAVHLSCCKATGENT